MTDKQFELIEKLVQKQISIEKFKLLFPLNFKTEPDLLLENLEQAFKRKDAKQTEYIFRILFLDELLLRSNKYAPLLSDLLLADWHYIHEDVAMILREIKSPDSVKALKNAAIMKLDYLDYDDTFQLARKCIKALHAVHTESSKTALSELIQYNNPIIAKYAQKELNRW